MPLFAYTLPAVILPVTSKLVNVPTDVIFDCAFVVNVPVIRLTSILLAEILSSTLRLLATFTPIPVTIKTFALPAALIVTLPLAAGILILLFPFASEPCKLPITAVLLTVNEGVVNTPVVLLKVKPVLAPKLLSSLN